MVKKKTKKSLGFSSLKLVTPRGSLLWPKLFKPDTKFNPDGVYSTGIVMHLEDPKVKEFLEKIKEFKEETNAGPKLPFSMDKDEGTVTLRCKTMELPAVVDAKKNPIDKDPNVGNGTVAKISVAFVPYEMQGGGLTCYIQAVQLIEVKHYTPGVDGFDEEDGYVYDNDEPGDNQVSDSNEGVNDGDIEF